MITRYDRDVGNYYPLEKLWEYALSAIVGLQEIKISNISYKKSNWKCRQKDVDHFVQA